MCHAAGEYDVTEPASEILEEDEIVDGEPGNTDNSPYGLRVSLCKITPIFIFRIQSGAL
jgi:hypothetical protein